MGDNHPDDSSNEIITPSDGGNSNPQEENLSEDAEGSHNSDDNSDRNYEVSLWSLHREPRWLKLSYLLSTLSIVNGTMAIYFLFGSLQLFIEIDSSTSFYEVFFTSYEVVTFSIVVFTTLLSGLTWREICKEYRVPMSHFKLPSTFVVLIFTAFVLGVIFLNAALELSIFLLHKYGIPFVK